MAKFVFYAEDHEVWLEKLRDAGIIPEEAISAVVKVNDKVVERSWELAESHGEELTWRHRRGS